jgi:hypothetical protein
VVAGDADGVDVAEQPSGLLQAAPAELTVLPDHLFELCLGGREQGVAGLWVRDAAGHRGADGDAPGVHADDLEA